jgi:hypothetical protein
MCGCCPVGVVAWRSVPRCHGNHGRRSSATKMSSLRPALSTDASVCRHVHILGNPKPASAKADQRHRPDLQRCRMSEGEECKGTATDEFPTVLGAPATSPGQVRPVQVMGTRKLDITVSIGPVTGCRARSSAVRHSPVRPPRNVTFRPLPPRCSQMLKLINFRPQSVDSPRDQQGIVDDAFGAENDGEICFAPAAAMTDQARSRNTGSGAALGSPCLGSRE